MREWSHGGAARTMRKAGRIPALFRVLRRSRLGRYMTSQRRRELVLLRSAYRGERGRAVERCNELCASIGAKPKEHPCEVREWQELGARLPRFAAINDHGGSRPSFSDNGRSNAKRQSKRNQSAKHCATGQRSPGNRQGHLHLTLEASVLRMGRKHSTLVGQHHIVPAVPPACHGFLP